MFGGVTELDVGVCECGVSVGIGIFSGRREDVYARTLIKTCECVCEAPCWSIHSTPRH